MGQRLRAQRCVIVPRDRIAKMRSLLRRFLGARRPRVIAVVGLCREDIEAGVEHAYTSGSGLPVWAWCAADTEPVSGCDRFVARATASRIRRDLRQVWPALTIVSWTGQPGAGAVKLAPFTAPPFRIVIRNEAQGFFPARPGPLASHACRRLRDAATDGAQALGLWLYWRAYRVYSLAYRAAQRARDAIRLLYSLAYRAAQRARDVIRWLYSLLYRSVERDRDVIRILDGRLVRLLAKHRRNIRGHLEDRGWKVPHHGNDRTTYILGLFGSGRWYLNDLIVAHTGKRGKYLRDSIRLHPGPTSMIYSGHATLKYASRFQVVPEYTARIVEAVRLGIADSIFIYRHPLDSLLTNWLFWRTYMRKKRWIWGISQVYSNTGDLCADLETNFDDFRAFAEGDPAFFAQAPGPRVLSFAEFVEETELHVQSATLSLRLEDFMVDPAEEFLRMTRVMSVEVCANGRSIDVPRTSAYRWRAVKEGVPRFGAFVADLDAETRRRIARLGYSTG